MGMLEDMVVGVDTMNNVQIVLEANAAREVFLAAPLYSLGQGVYMCCDIIVCTTVCERAVRMVSDFIFPHAQRRANANICLLCIK